MHRDIDVGRSVRSPTRQRPTAKELLKHKFIKNAKKASYLTELIERYDRFKTTKEGDAAVDVQAHNTMVYVWSPWSPSRFRSLETAADELQTRSRWCRWRAMGL